MLIPGGKDCFNRVALSWSCTLNVYKYLEQRTLNFVTEPVFLIFTDLASLRRAFKRKSLISAICFGWNCDDKQREREEVEKVSEMNNTSLSEWFERGVSVLQEEKIDFFVPQRQPNREGFAQKIPNSKSILAKDTRRDSRFVRIEKVSFFEALLSRYRSSILIGAILPARRLSLFAARHPISRPSSEKRRLIINRAYSLSRARYSWKLNAAWIAPHSAFCARCDHHNTETTTRKQQQGIKRTMFMKLLEWALKKLRSEQCDRQNYGAAAAGKNSEKKIWMYTRAPHLLDRKEACSLSSLEHYCRRPSSSSSKYYY